MRVANVAKSQVGLGNEEINPSGGFGLDSMLFVVGDAPKRTVRIFPPSRPEVQIRSQLAWMAVLRDRGIGVPRLSQLSRQGPILEIPDAGGTWRCVFFDWIEGDILARMPDYGKSADIARELGRLIARMHDAAQEFVPPPWFSLPRRDLKCFYQQLRSFNFDGMTVSADAQQRCAELGDIVTGVLARLGQSKATFGVVHNDLSCRNIIVAPCEIHVIDFESTCWGFYFADIVRALDLGVEADQRAALLTGYAEKRPLPAALKANLHHFLAAGEFAQQWF
jgi:Ser/Thr protein kinase RdoA (MazF antagonist)